MKWPLTEVSRPTRGTKVWRKTSPRATTPLRRPRQAVCGTNYASHERHCFFWVGRLVPAEDLLSSLIIKSVGCWWGKVVGPHCLSTFSACPKPDCRGLRLIRHRDCQFERERITPEV